MSKKNISTILLTVFPILLFVINFITKNLFLTADAIALDEPFTIYHAQLPLGVLIEQLKNYNNPPLYEILLHFWIKAFGISEFSVRLFPMLLACLSPLALYYFAHRNFSRRIAIASSLLLTFSELLMYYAHDCRAYSLFLLLSLLSMYYYLETVYIERKTIIKSGLFVFLSVLLIYTHYFGVFVLCLQGIHLILFYRKQFLSFVLLYLGIFLFYLPHLYPLILRFGDSVKNGTWLEAPSGIESLYNMLWVFSNFPFVTVICICLLFFALLKFIYQRKHIQIKDKNILILVWFIFAFVGMYLISFKVPMYIGRYLIYALPAYYLLLGICVEFLITKDTYINYALAGLILCFAITMNYNPSKKQPIRKAVSLVKENTNKHKVVLIYPAHILSAFAYNYDKTAFSLVSDPREYLQMDSVLKNQKIFGIQKLNDLSVLDTISFNEIELLSIGGERNLASDSIQDFLYKNMKLQWKKNLEHDWLLSSYKK